MNRVAQILIVVLALLASACSTSRKTVATNTAAEAQLTATTEQQHHAGSTEKAAVITNVTTDERRNVVIDFATVEFYPGGVPSVPSDSTPAPDWLNAIIAAAATEEGQKAKPPNVKSVTKGRAVLNGKKRADPHRSPGREEGDRGQRNKTGRRSQQQGSSRNQDRGKAEVLFLGLAIFGSRRRVRYIRNNLGREDSDKDAPRRQEPLNESREPGGGFRLHYWHPDIRKIPEKVRFWVLIRVLIR